MEIWRNSNQNDNFKERVDYSFIQHIQTYWSTQIHLNKNDILYETQTLLAIQICSWK